MERQLVAKESYLAASSEIRSNDRQRLLAETKRLLQEVVGSSNQRQQEFTDQNKNVSDTTPSVVPTDQHAAIGKGSSVTGKNAKP
jgi:hypothetical protein